MRHLTFYKNNTRHNKRIEFIGIDKDLLSAVEMYGVNVYPKEGEDFENGIISDSGKELMDENEYKEYSDTGIGYIDLGDEVFFTTRLKDIDYDEFKVLPKHIQIDYVNLFLDEEINESIFDYTVENYGLEYAFKCLPHFWGEMKEESLQEGEK